MTFSPLTRSWCSLWKSRSFLSFSQVDFAFSATILAYLSSSVILAIFASILAFLFLMSAIRPIPRSWKVPFFCSSYHSYWNTFIVFVIFPFTKKFRMKSSMTTSRSTVLGWAMTLVSVWFLSVTVLLAFAFLAFLFSVLNLRALKSFKSSSLETSSPSPYMTEMAARSKSPVASASIRIFSNSWSSSSSSVISRFSIM
jgi:hypothetical protein